jgi:hypothetical protein
MKNATKENIDVHPVMRKTNLRAYNIGQSESCEIVRGTDHLTISKHSRLTKMCSFLLNDHRKGHTCIFYIQDTKGAKTIGTCDYQTQTASLYNPS